MDQEPLRINEPLIVPAALDPDAVKIVRRLRRYGHEAYFVGGCVRDLSLGHIPKDFDIATSARPRQIKRLFRNSRIIGRRFKLVHVQFGSKVIEVSTFRQKPKPGQSDPDESLGDGGGEEFEADHGHERDPDAEVVPVETVRADDGLGDPESGARDGDEDDDSETDDAGSDEDLLIRRDNVFGTAEEDALRRDFTINALFYDVDDNVVIDYVGGTKDLEERVIRTIGDPLIRFPEDPVRILRAIKFAARLSFHIDPATYDAMVQFAPDLQKCAAPRLAEELLKLLSCGAAAAAFELLERTGVLAVVLPQLAEMLERGTVADEAGLDVRSRLLRRLDALDQTDRGRRSFQNAVYLTTLFADLVREVLGADEQRDPGVLIDEALRPISQRMSISRRDAFLIKQIVLAQSRLKKTKSGSRRRRVKPADYVRRDYFEPAFAFLRIETVAYGLDPAHVRRWDDLLDQVFGRRRRDRDDGRRFASTTQNAENAGPVDDDGAGEDSEGAADETNDEANGDAVGAEADGDAGADDAESADARSEDASHRLESGEPGERRGRRRRRRRGGRNRNRNRDDRAPTDGSVGGAPLDDERVPSEGGDVASTSEFDDASRDGDGEVRENVEVPGEGGAESRPSGGDEPREGGRRGRRRRGRGRGRDRDRNDRAVDAAKPHDLDDRDADDVDVSARDAAPVEDEAAAEDDLFVDWDAPLPKVGDPGPISVIRTGIDQTEKKGRRKKRRFDSAARDLSKEIEDQPSLQALKMTEGDPRGHEATRPQKVRRPKEEPIEPRTREKPFDFEVDFEAIEDVFRW